MINTMQNLLNPTLSGNSNSQIPNTKTDSSLGSGNNTFTTQSSGGMLKEQEPLVSSETGTIEEVYVDIELEPSLEAIGVTKKSETIQLPPDVARMGVQAVGPNQPVAFTGVIKLPLTDDQIIVGLHAQIVSSLRWLAEWCLRQLKKAHIHLKSMGGKIVRETI